MNEVNILIHKKNNILLNDKSKKILEELVNGSQKLFLDKTKLKELKSLVNNGLVTIHDSSYTITDYGIYLITANKFKITFLSLCALSEIYVMQSNFLNPKNNRAI